MERLFFCVLKMSTISLYCIVMVLLVRLLLKKAPKIYSYLLWMIVFIRLICPVVLESPFSLVPGGFLEMGGIFRGGTEEDMDSQAGKQAFKGQEWEKETEGNSSVDYYPQKKADNMVAKKDGGADTAMQSGRQEVLIKTGAGIWFFGMVFFLVYFAGAVIGMKGKLAGAKKLPEAFYERKKGDCKRIYISESIKTAFVFGVFKPGIYLPAGMEEREREYVIRHEQIHVRRRDDRIKMAAFLIACIHWFNPFVWLSYLLMEKDMEMSCDERVLREMGEEIKKAYSSSLLSMAIYEKEFGRIPIAFGEKDVKNRIQNVLSYKKAKAGITIFGILLCVMAAAGLLTNHKGKNQEETGILAGQEEEKLPEAGKEGNEDIEEKENEQQKEAALKKWTEAFSGRDGNGLYELSQNKEQFLQWELVESVNNGTEYSFGWSSPWPWTGDYRIVIKDDLADIYYYAVTSQPSVNVWKENVELVKQEDNSYRINHRELNMYDEINTKEEFEQAYLVEGGYAYYGKEQQFFTEGVAYQLAAGERQEMYNAYLEPDSSAVAMLYLSGGNAEVKEKREKEVLISYTFSDGSVIEVPMYLTQEYVEPAEGENGKTISLWLPWKQEMIKRDVGGKDNQEVNQFQKQTEGTKELTMEEVKELPHKREVTLEEFEAYANGVYESFSDENALNGCLNFALSYEGESYELNIYYMLEDNKIDSIRLVRMETGEMILLRAMPKYEQNPDVEGFLQNHTILYDSV